jgi:hypothetical protein
LRQLRDQASEDVSYASEIRSFLESDAKRQALRNLIDERPAYERRLERRAAQAAALPSLEEFSLFLDYRVLEGETEGSLKKLVPVVLARLTFDEPLQGSDVVAFQISDEFLETMAEEIARIRSLLEKMQGEFQERLL